MKLVKKIKILKQQAKCWMAVCHHAVFLFPELFNAPHILVDPPAITASETVIELLTELAARRKSDAGTIDMKIIRSEGLQWRENNIKIGDINKTADDPNEILFNQSRWYNSLKEDPTTGTKVCDGCGLTMLPLDAKSLTNWINMHYIHRAMKIVLDDIDERSPFTLTSQAELMKKRMDETVEKIMSNHNTPTMRQPGLVEQALGRSIEKLRSSDHHGDGFKNELGEDVEIPKEKTRVNCLDCGVDREYGRGTLCFNDEPHTWNT